MASFVSRRAFLALTTTWAASALVTACAPTAGTPTPAKPAPAGAPAGAAPTAKPAVTLRVAFIGTQARAEQLKGFATAFESTHPGVTLEFSPFQATDWDQFFVKLLTEIAGGKTADLVSVATEGTQLFAGRGLALPLDEFVRRDKEAMREYFADVAPALVEAMMYEGSLYELPFDFNAANMYLNLTVFEKYGITPPTDDWTVTEFREIARKISSKKDATGQPEVFGYAWTNRHWGGYIPWVFVNDSNILTEERAPGGDWLWSTFYADSPAAKGRGGGWRWNASKANDPKNVEALQLLVEMTRERSAMDPATGGGAAQQTNFVQGKVAMTPAGGFWSAGLKNAGMKEGTWDVRLFPKWRTQRHQFGTAGLLGLKASPARDQIWEFMKYWVSKEVMGTVIGTPMGTTPTRRSLVTAERAAGIKNWRIFYDTLDKLPDTAPIPAPPESNQLATLLVKYVDLAITGERTPRAALDELHQELTKLFAKRGA